MLPLTEDQARQILEHAGLKAADVGGVMWHRMISAVQVSYKLGTEAELLKVVYKN